MDFEWDEDNEEHIARHGVVPDEAEEVLLDPRRVPAPAYSVYGERRRGVIGATEDGRVLAVIYAARGGVVRIITARDADPDEKRRYRRR